MPYRTVSFNSEPPAARQQLDIVEAVEGPPPRASSLGSEWEAATGTGHRHIDELREVHPGARVYA